MFLNRLAPRLTNISRPITRISTRNFSQTSVIMGYTKTIHREGSGPSPNPGEQVTIEYTGFLKDTSKPDNKGAQYVSLIVPSLSTLCGAI